jgi:hypothetical protein
MNEADYDNKLSPVQNSLEPGNAIGKKRYQ